MRVGVIGRGNWGGVYCRILREKGVSHWQAGRDWREHPKADRIIIACATPVHYEVAHEVMSSGTPVLIEKPAVMTTMEAHELLAFGGVAYVAHTRLYDPAWQAFSDSIVEPITSIEAWAGGVTESDPDADLNWAAHLVPMCEALAVVPTRERVRFHITDERQPLRFVVNGKHEFRDTEGAMDNLVTQFLRASGLDNYGLYLAMSFARYWETKECHSQTTPP